MARTTRQHPIWDGIALRRTRAAADPDSAPRPVALPATWDDEAAAALAALAPGAGPVALPTLAAGWIGRLLEKGLQAGQLDPARAPTLEAALHGLVAQRRGAPGAATWRGEARAEPRFVLNLPGFLDEAGGFDSAAYARAVGTAVEAADILSGGKTPRLRVGFADLAGLLAALGLAYDSADARAVATCISALSRGAAECASARIADRLGAREPAALLWPAPPAHCAVPGLALAARRALDLAGASHGLRHQGGFALTLPDAAEALLGAETGGLAPAQGATRFAHDAEGRVAERPTRAAERAGAQAARLLAPVSTAARAAMEAAVAPYLHAASPAPLARPQPARPLPPPRPAPARTQLWRVVVGGQRVTLQASETPEGALGAIALSVAGQRGGAEAMLQAVNIGLARGVPLSDYVSAFAYARGSVAGLGAGPVEGDGEILCATSVLDWAFRRLALAYLGAAESRALWPDPRLEDCAADSATAPGDRGPMLPLPLPQRPSPAARRRFFRLVG
ncbi:hypothetical protein [Teichococcus vastitatis]|uniref:TSCPD domain-containing protein n=1 Tax=Teichococcus vastitatis TaxID=2307076 RepID=A0ABS9WAR2_9PROT|nr:hypothetical protein [Pseudoroseomonas vastitatis]MCI0756396.1 hypothetical protein [Pseudoroseomonas vastitatis]